MTVLVLSMLIRNQKKMIWNNVMHIRLDQKHEKKSAYQIYYLWQGIIGMIFVSHGVMTAMPHRRMRKSQYVKYTAEINMSQKKN